MKPKLSVFIVDLHVQFLLKEFIQKMEHLRKLKSVTAEIVQVQVHRLRVTVSPPGDFPAKLSYLKT